MLILGLLVMYFDAAVVFVTNSSLLFRLAVAILWFVRIFFGVITRHVCNQYILHAFKQVVLLLSNLQCILVHITQLSLFSFLPLSLLPFSSLFEG